MSFKRIIQRLDVFKVVPDEYKESSILGLLASVVFLALAGVLIANQVLILCSTNIESQILIDHLKDDQDLNVNLEVQLDQYPCTLLSLDKLDAVYTHTVDVQENLVKYRTNTGGEIIEVQQNSDALTFDQRIDLARQQVQNKEGCLLTGNFTIKMVPGNFHISFHKYSMEMTQLMSNDGYQPDFSHVVRRLTFGNESQSEETQVTWDFGIESLHSLESVAEKNLIGRVGYPHGVLHRLNIVPSKFDYPSGESREIYQYSAATFPFVGGLLSITFEFHIENVFMNYKKAPGSWSHFFIQCATILGGTYMLLSIFKLLIEDGILNIIFKRRIGKLE